MNLHHVPRLSLERLSRRHAPEMFEVLSDREIFRFLDYGPPGSVEALEASYARLEVGHSPDRSEIWLNWIVRLNSGAAIGYVQATVQPKCKTSVGYVLASRYWGQGYAAEAMRDMLSYLDREHPVPLLVAVVEAENERSIALLNRLGFEASSAAASLDIRLSESERLYVCRQRKQNGSK